LPNDGAQPNKRFMHTARGMHRRNLEQGTSAEKKN
jgi:hypothetical protein